MLKGTGELGGTMNSDMLPNYPGSELKKLLPLQMMNWANELSEMMGAEHDSIDPDGMDGAERYFNSLGATLEFYHNDDYGARVVSFLDLLNGRPLFLVQYCGYDAEIIRVFPFLGFEEEH